MRQIVNNCAVGSCPADDAELRMLLQKVAGDSSDTIAAHLRSEWLHSVTALRDLSEDGWVELALPSALEQALRHHLSTTPCLKSGAVSVVAAPVLRRRHSLPNRRRTTADGPPADICLRGWGRNLPGTRRPQQGQRFDPRPPPSQAMEVSNANKARWLLRSIENEFRMKGHTAQVSLAKRFQLLPPSVGEEPLVSVLLEQRMACLGMDGDVGLVVRHCFGPLPACKDEALTRLRGCDRPARRAAIQDTFARLKAASGNDPVQISASSLRQAFAPRQHPAVRSRGKSAVDALMEFHELLSAEGLADSNREIRLGDLIRVCGALGMHVERDDTFDDFLRVVLPGDSNDTASESVFAMIARLYSGLQESSLEQLEKIAAMAHTAVAEGSPEGLLSRPNFPAIGGGILLSLPQSSHPLFSDYHGRFFRGHAFRGLPPELRTAGALERTPKRGPLLRPGFVLWLESWRLRGVGGAVAECLFAHFDEDASGELDLDEVRSFLVELAGQLTERRRRELDRVLGGASSSAEALRLEMMAEFVGPFLEDDAAFEAWLSAEPR